MITSTDKSIPHPLVGDPKRQATDSLLGYDYQIWRTLELWMRLNANEVLYIECAEDFDLITSEGGTTNQVKNSTSNITLGSKDVRESIVNHLNNTQRNEGRSVKMRYLTRGDIGCEKGKPFGKERGLDLWRSAARGDARADNLLKDYLKANPNGDQELQNFLMISTHEQRIDKLYSSIDWIVNEPVIEAVRLIVERASIEYGNRRGIATHISSNAVKALLERCRQLAEEKLPELRSLTATDFQKTFDENTCVHVPATYAMISMLEKSLTQASTGSQTLAFSSFDDSGELPPLPKYVMPRQNFCEQAEASLANGPILIVGSEGKGKSIIANLLARTCAPSSYWAFLPDEVERANLSLERLLLLVRSGVAPKCFVLDDVPAFQGLDDQIWMRLSALLESCHANDIQLLMTAKGVPDHLVDSRFRGASVQVLGVPSVTQAEVELFFESLGCKNESHKKTWAKTILMQTGNGHPKLVYLAGLELKDKGWPIPKIENFMTPPASIEEARANARQSVAKTVQEPDKRFLYTLSVSALPFSRKLALKVGDMLNINAPIRSISAGAIILSQRARQPSETYYVQVRLVVWLLSLPLIKESLLATVSVLSIVFSDQWSSHITFPAGLIQPRYSIPALQDAMRFKGAAIERLIRLIRAGSIATGMTVPDSTLAVLLNIQGKS